MIPSGFSTKIVCVCVYIPLMRATRLTHLVYVNFINLRTFGGVQIMKLLIM
jgi:hypothetical protein